MIANENEAKVMTKHIPCDCKCKFNSTTCNSNQKWNNRTCQCECKNYHVQKRLLVESSEHMYFRIVSISKVLLILQ